MMPRRRIGWILKASANVCNMGSSPSSAHLAIPLPASQCTLLTLTFEIGVSMWNQAKAASRKYEGSKEVKEDLKIAALGMPLFRCYSS